MSDWLLLELSRACLSREDMSNWMVLGISRMYWNRERVPDWLVLELSGVNSLGIMKQRGARLASAGTLRECTGEAGYQTD